MTLSNVRIDPSTPSQHPHALPTAASRPHTTLIGSVLLNVSGKLLMMQEEADNGLYEDSSFTTEKEVRVCTYVATLNFFFPSTEYIQCS